VSLKQVKISFKMQFMIWFAGLRGAIAFALSQNMPGPHKGAYETTTLGVVFFTTVVCGGLTEKVLARTGMKREAGGAYAPIGDGDNAAGQGLGQGLLGHEKGLSLGPKVAAKKSGVHGWWVGVDGRVMKPLFGGRPRDFDDADTNPFNGDH
jgi:sodium/hydrogen exchanger 8